MPLHRRVLLLRYFIMIKSINIGFFPASDPLEQTLERVKAAGFGAVELNMNEETVSDTAFRMRMRSRSKRFSKSTGSPVQA